MIKKTLPIGTYQYANTQAGSRKLVNCTAEQATPDSGNQIVLRRMPGIDSFATAGSRVRGELFFLGSLYVVSDTSLFKVTEGGIVTTIGAIPGSGRVSMSENGTSLVIVTSPEAYSFDGTTFSQITDSVFVGFGGASDVGYLDGFLIFTVPNSRRAFVSGLNALTFNGLDFTTIDGATDNLVGLIVDHREVIFLKERTMELFYNPGDIAVGFPLRRSPNGFREIGCATADTAAKLGGSVYWLANDNTVRRLSGASSEIISTVGIAKFIDNASEAFGFAYTFEEKHYYVLTVPGSTLEYDILAKEWHNRETFTKDNWDVLSILEGYGSLLAFNSQTGEIGKLNNATRTEWGGIQKSSWTYQEIDGDGVRVFHDRLEISMTTGVGLTSGQGSDPTMELEMSDDGKLYSSFEVRNLGKIGEHQTRVVFHRLGSAYKRVYRGSITDAVDFIAFDTNLELRGGRF